MMWRGRVLSMIAVATVLLAMVSVAVVSADDPLFYNVQPKVEPA